MKQLFFILFLLFLTGCFMPGGKEYFQDKVQKMPVKAPKHAEVQKQAADYLHKKTEQTVIAAIKENSSTNVLKPAIEAEEVADSLSDSLGKPLEPWEKSHKELIKKLNNLEAQYAVLLEEFRKDNDKNAGKQIEGTGLFKIGFFTQFIVLAVILAAVYVGVKILGLFNPAVQVGSQVLSGGFRGVTKIAVKGFGQVIKAGEVFKQKVDKTIEDPQTKEIIMELFRQAHLEKQDAEVQDAIKKLTNADI